MTGNTTNNHWLHSTTGYYHLYIRYRQQAGGDHWTVFGVTKNGASDCVGVSARTGSEDSHNEAYDVLYRVDGMTTSYQLQGWDGGSNKSVNDQMHKVNQLGLFMILLLALQMQMVV